MRQSKNVKFKSSIVFASLISLKVLDISSAFFYIYNDTLIIFQICKAVVQFNRYGYKSQYM